MVPTPIKLELRWKVGNGRIYRVGPLDHAGVNHILFLTAARLDLVGLILLVKFWVLCPPNHQLRVFLIRHGRQWSFFAEGVS